VNFKTTIGKAFTRIKSGPIAVTIRQKVAKIKLHPREFSVASTILRDEIRVAILRITTPPTAATLERRARMVPPARSKALFVVTGTLVNGINVEPWKDGYHVTHPPNRLRDPSMKARLIFELDFRTIAKHVAESIADTLANQWEGK